LANELEVLASATTRTAPAGDASNVDENALTFFSQYYKDLRQFDKVVSLYESATKREPTSEEFLCSLFMAYVRMKDYKNQFLTAQKLYKLTQKIPYYNWAVISVLLQIDDNANQLTQTLYIPMALKMLEKEFFDETRQQTKAYGEMECLLYLHSLELKEDFSKALTFLEKHLEALTKSPSNESMLSAYFSHDKPLIYNYKAGHFDVAYRLAKQFLIEDNFLWNWYEVLFDSFFKFDQAKQEEFIQDLHDFILTTPDGITDLRNIYLARIELGLRWQSIRSKTLPQLASTYLSDTFFNQITSYIETYSLKTTGLIMYDIYRAFEYFSKDDRIRLHEYLIKQLTSDNIQYIINILYCARLCGDIHRSWLSENHHSLIERLFDLANQSSNLSIELFLLIVNIMDENNQSKIDLYNLLDRTYEKDSTNFDLKLYLYQLALDFNCIKIMKEFFDRLEIKNIQYFSLSYLLTDHYLRIHRHYRHMKNFFNYLTNILLVYTDDSWSQIMFCYKYGNFLRINEIRTFSDCYLSYSLTYIQSLIGAMVIDVMQSGNRYHSIVNIFKNSSNQVLFDQKDIMRSLFYHNDTLKVQDTRDFDVWSKIDYR
jgi:N-terminal acetyltransferase B complex non-catalytic subunit